MRFLASIIVAVVFGLIATSHGKTPTPHDRTAPPQAPSVESCLAAHPDLRPNSDGCIGKVSDACIGPDETAKPPSEVVTCVDREQAQWDKILNTAFQSLHDGLDETQVVKLRDMQRSWLETRKRTCEFYYDYFQGTMAAPMIATCLNRETARRAVFLRGFAQDMATWVK